MARIIVKNFPVVFVVSLLVIHSSMSSSIQNELLESLTFRLDNLQVKMDHLESKIAEQSEEIIKLKATIDTQLECNLSHLMNVKESSTAGDCTTVRKPIVPASCRELAIMGHSNHGLYLVQNRDTKKIETIFCDFRTLGSQEFIGTIDVKTKSIHFYVQRNTSFSTMNAVIPFELARLNEGEAMNLTSGIFTAPVPGIYHFEFSGVKASTATSLFIFLQVNGVDIGRTNSNQPSTGSYDSLSLSASLRLKANDRVNLYNYGAGNYGFVLYDNDLYHDTHFTGWLVEEELI